MKYIVNTIHIGTDKPYVRVRTVDGARVLADVTIADRPLREVVNEALDRAEARLLFDEGRRTCGRPSCTGAWLTNGDRAQDVHVYRSVGDLVRELEREAKAAEDGHKATAQRLFDEGWRVVEREAGGDVIERDDVRVVSSYELRQAMWKIQEGAKPLTNPPPRWTMTKRQREARRKDARDLSIQAHMSKWYPTCSPGEKTFPPHDCPGMRENGPVLFLSESMAETKAASAVARGGDYLTTNDAWFRRTMCGEHWVRASDPDLL